MTDRDDSTTWPLDTLVLRGGMGDAYELARRRDLAGLTAAALDGILGRPVPNPVPTEDRWKP